jgi:hypothetical protein
MSFNHHYPNGENLSVGGFDCEELKNNIKCYYFNSLYIYLDTMERNLGNFCPKPTFKRLRGMIWIFRWCTDFEKNPATVEKMAFLLESEFITAHLENLLPMYKIVYFWSSSSIFDNLYSLILFCKWYVIKLYRLIFNK